ncbi:MAG: hypothetical protein JWR09_5071 [Mucilaginibacter sp.]|nr:hypothetical protein [Mucilaginibacter sp.]
MKNATIILFLCVILFSCRKNKDNNILISGILTDCPTNTVCTYSYSENADISGTGQLVPGGDRVFWYKNTNNTPGSCDISSQLNFKTSLSNNSFVINASQIVAGQATYGQSCICCNLIGLKPIGGGIKGKKTDATHWLINAMVILGDQNNKPFDTLKVNQYFTLKTP